jgi:hypothetical protein
MILNSYHDEELNQQEQCRVPPLLLRSQTECRGVSSSSESLAPGLNSTTRVGITIITSYHIILYYCTPTPTPTLIFLLFHHDHDEQ